MVITKVEFLKAFLAITFSGKPQSAPYLLKSSSSILSIVACVIFNIGPAFMRPKVTTGKIKWPTAFLKAAKFKSIILSINNEPVTEGGGIKKKSILPNGAGTIVSTV